MLSSTPMPACRQCRQPNAEDANFCRQCGAALAVSDGSSAPVVDVSPPTSIQTDEELWRQFIGPNADRYLEQFKKFSANGQPKFALTWNWPAFLFISFLWFLYRKMYLHALVYAIGPMVSTYLTGDITVGIVWSIMAGATANYLYYWYCREQIAEIKKRSVSHPEMRDLALKEAGGIQPYVIWVGVAFYILFVATLIKMIQEGPPDSNKVPTKPAKPAAVTST
jgi:hypothetical protein